MTGSRKPPVNRIFASLLFFFILTLQGYPFSDSAWDPVVYSGTFYVLLEDSGPLDPHSYDEDEAIKRLLAEARWVFSAMIYGFNFDYIPYDSARGVPEEFTLEPVHQIPWGDPAMRISNGRYDDGVYYADISYRVNEQQLPWVQGWESNTNTDVISSGEGSLFFGLDGKIDSIKSTVKQALRDHLRPRVYNKPRRMSGRGRLASVPDWSMSSGEYRCKARITLDLDEILEYRIY